MGCRADRQEQERGRGACDVSIRSTAPERFLVYTPTVACAYDAVPAVFTAEIAPSLQVARQASENIRCMISRAINIDTCIHTRRGCGEAAVREADIRR